MSQIARCPACRTCFKVADDQLQVSQGWVRCGRCQEIFDATRHLQTTAQEVPSHSLAEPLSDAALPPRVLSEAVVTVADAEPSPALAVSPAEVMSSATSEPSLEPSFVQHADRQAQSAKTRRWWWAASVLLLAALLLQVARHERDRLAAEHPALAPALHTLCKALACQVQPWQQIQAVVIDSASFHPTAPDTYELGLVLRNSLPQALALPALEVSLLDSQEQVLVRKVVPAADLQTAGVPQLAGRATWQGNLQLVWTPPQAPASDAATVTTATPPTAVNAATTATTATTAWPVAGYRLRAFYP